MKNLKIIDNQTELNESSHAAIRMAPVMRYLND